MERLIQSARPKLAADARRLQELLAESRKRLAPLNEPFDLDLGVHRWLRGQREEAYSDWLEWVAREAGTPRRLFRLFGLGRPPDALDESSVPHLQRECCVPYGHADHEGRLDLVIRCGRKAIIVVEVKTTTAEESDTVKHQGYQRWLREQDYPFKDSVLLAVSGEEEIYDEFRFLSWSNVCIEMRRLAVDFCKEGRLSVAALTLAFAAAVEQNLLGFRADLVRQLSNGSAAILNSRVVTFLEQFLTRLD